LAPQRWLILHVARGRRRIGDVSLDVWVFADGEHFHCIEPPAIDGVLLIFDLREG
jgi:hypothetical protein